MRNVSRFQRLKFCSVVVIVLPHNEITDNIAQLKNVPLTHEYYSLRTIFCCIGNYADAQQSMSRLDDVKEECDPKSHQSYGVLNKSWGESGDKKSSAGSKTALVVDDGAMCRKACGAMMQEMGFKVEYANDGKEAVDKIFREDTESGVIAVNYYEVVMMDNFMPNMDGSDAVTLLRLNGYTGTIIGLTYDIFDEPSKLFRLLNINFFCSAVSLFCYYFVQLFFHMCCFLFCRSLLWISFLSFSPLFFAFFTFA